MSNFPIFDPSYGFHTKIKTTQPYVLPTIKNLAPGPKPGQQQLHQTFGPKLGFLTTLIKGVVAE